MLKKLILILLLVCTTSINIVFAESVPPADTSTKTNTPEITTTITDTTEVELKEGLSELEAYKLLYENQKHSNDKILDTVYWALGIAVSIVLLFIGANIFINFRINKRENELIQLENSSKLVSLHLESLDKLKKDFDDHADQLIKKVLGDLENFKNQINDQFNTFKDTLSIEIQSTQRTIKSVEESLTQREIPLIKEQFNSGLIQLEKKVDRVNINNQLLEAEMWMDKEIFPIAVAQFARAGLEIVTKKVNEGLLVDVNHKIYDCLKRMETISTFKISDINAYLMKMRVEDEILKKKITEEISKLSIE
jgi:hypothetical protein